MHASGRMRCGGAHATGAAAEASSSLWDVSWACHGRVLTTGVAAEASANRSARVTARMAAELA